MPRFSVVVACAESVVETVWCVVAVSAVSTVSRWLLHPAVMRLSAMRAAVAVLFGFMVYYF